MDTLSFLHKRKMKELKGQDRNDYLLKNAPLIFAHHGERNQFNKYYRQYLYNINPNLNVWKNKLNEVNNEAPRDIIVRTEPKTITEAIPPPAIAPEVNLAAYFMS